jgi:hypothetical protein
MNITNHSHILCYAQFNIILSFHLTLSTSWHFTESILISKGIENFVSSFLKCKHMYLLSSY